MVGTMAKIDDSVKKKVPELRFKGFTDDWEERKLKELGDIQTGNTPPTSDLDNYSLDGVLWVTPTDIKSLVISNTAKKLSQVGVTKARIAKAGSILVTSIASIGKNTLLRMDAGFNQQINSLTPTSENDSYFLLTQSEKWSEKMKQTAASATMQIVNKTDFSNISTYVPVHKEEQEKIGSFFKQLDGTIALHQRKLDLLKEQKKGYLQKMFPKNGAKVPELRFAGFADDWEERKLEDISEIIDGDRGKNYPSGDDFKNNGHTLFLSAANVTKQGFLFKETQYITKLKSESLGSGKVILNDIILTSRGSIGHIGFYDKKTHEYIPQARINSGMLILRTDKLNSPSFIAQFLKSPWGIKQIKLISFGSAQPQLTKKDIKNFKIILPKMEEQEKIGSFFQKLDDTIALHQRKSDLLKEQKKGFLQKMFV